MMTKIEKSNQCEYRTNDWIEQKQNRLVFTLEIRRSESFDIFKNKYYQEQKSHFWINSVRLFFYHSHIFF